MHVAKLAVLEVEGEMEGMQCQTAVTCFRFPSAVHAPV